MWAVQGHLPGLVVQQRVALVWPFQDTHLAVGHLNAWSSWLWHCQDLLCGVRLGMTSLEKAPGGLAAHPGTQLMLMCWIKRWMCKGGMERLVPWAGVARKCVWLGEKCGKPLPGCMQGAVHGKPAAAAAPTALQPSH